MEKIYIIEITDWDNKYPNISISPNTPALLADELAKTIKEWFKQNK